MSEVEQLAEQLRTLGVIGPGPDFPTYVAEGLMASGWWAEHNFEERLWGAVLIPDPDPIDVEAAVDRAARVRRARLVAGWPFHETRQYDDLAPEIQERYRFAVRPYVEAALAVPDEFDDHTPTAPDSAGGPTA